jgi:tetratricopeptide (TPR) repeat protein
MKNYINIAAMLLLAATLFVACGKEFLDKKPDKSLMVPQDYDDLQALLDNSNTVMNFTPSLSVMASDEVHVTDNGFATAQLMDRNAYLWAQNSYEGLAVPDWNSQYQQVLYANVVLDDLMTVKRGQEQPARHNEIRGAALFFRAVAFFQIAQQFAVPYQKSGAGKDLGIPLRLAADIKLPSTRATIAATYAQIISDLKDAATLLPPTVAFKTRPSQKAALGMLARIYLVMGDYEKARDFSDKCLGSGIQLIDYRTLESAAANPLPAALPNGNPEVIFYSILSSSQLVIAPAAAGVSEELYNSYSIGDLRKQLFFATRPNNVYNFKGSYSGNTHPFTGLAYDEILLIRAECYARLGETSRAVADLSLLHKNRYATGSEPSLRPANKEEALKLVLTERRKELLLRGLRWSDLRRLNLEAEHKVSLNRVYMGQRYQLPAGDLRYTFPIPDNVIFDSGIQQNKR